MYPLTPKCESTKAWTSVHKALLSLIAWLLGQLSGVTCRIFLLQASPGASDCISLPAMGYGGTINYAVGPGSVPTPNCVANSGSICGVYIPVGNGTGKVCAPQSTEAQLG